MAPKIKIDNVNAKPFRPLRSTCLTLIYLSFRYLLFFLLLFFSFLLACFCLFDSRSPPASLSLPKLSRSKSTFSSSFSSQKGKPLSSSCCLVSLLVSSLICFICFAACRSSLACLMPTTFVFSGFPRNRLPPNPRPFNKPKPAVWRATN